jgi:hypothetical protein
MNKIEIDGYEYFDVPKGAIVRVPNPKWDGDDPKTNFYYYIKLPKAITAQFLSVEEIQVEVISKTKSDKIKSATSLIREE